MTAGPHGEFAGGKGGVSDAAERKLSQATLTDRPGILSILEDTADGVVTLEIAGCSRESSKGKAR